MRELYLASELTKRPVVTLGGEAVAQVKDTVFDGASARVAGFTLAGRGLFSGPLHHGLPWTGVHALGPDALMIPDADVLADRAAVASGAEAAAGLVHGTEVLTDRGVALGTVLDVVVVSGRGGSGSGGSGAGGEVVGVRVASSEALGHHEREVYLALPGPVTMAGDTVLVPAPGTEHLAADLVQLDHVVARLRAVEVAGRGAEQGGPGRPDTGSPGQGAEWQPPHEPRRPGAAQLTKTQGAQGPLGTQGTQGAQGAQRAGATAASGAKDGTGAFDAHSHAHSEAHGDGSVLMVLTQLLGRAVIDAADATRLGAVEGLVLSASRGSRGRIAALRLRDAKSEHEIIAWGDLHALGPDAVIVTADRTASASTTAASLRTASSGSQDLLGRRLLTELGQDIGTLDDLTFDTGTGHVERLASSRGEQLAGERLIGVGPYALIVGVGVGVGVNVNVGGGPPPVDG